MTAGSLPEQADEQLRTAVWPAAHEISPAAPANQSENFGLAVILQQLGARAWLLIPVFFANRRAVPNCLVWTPRALTTTPRPTKKSTPNRSKRILSSCYVVFFSFVPIFGIIGLVYYVSSANVPVLASTTVQSCGRMSASKES
jgi:hypothetical protein